MFATNLLEERILNTFLGVTAQAPTALYVGLYLNNPSETGQAGTEVSYTGYERQPIAFSTPGTLNGGIGIQNTTDITFAKSPIAVGTATHIGVHDSVTGGNMLLYGDFTESIQIDADEAPVIVGGQAQWWLTGQASNAFKTKCMNYLHGQDLLGFTPYYAMYSGNPEQGAAELTGANYARVPVTFTAPEEQVGGQAMIRNSERFATERATESWGTLVFAAIMDSQTVGSSVYYNQKTPKEIRTGLMVIYDVNQLSISVN